MTNAHRRLLFHSKLHAYAIATVMVDNAGNYVVTAIEGDLLFPKTHILPDTDETRHWIYRPTGGPSLYTDYGALLVQPSTA